MNIILLVIVGLVVFYMLQNKQPQVVYVPPSKEVVVESTPWYVPNWGWGPYSYVSSGPWWGGSQQQQQQQGSGGQQQQQSGGGSQQQQQQ